MNELTLIEKLFAGLDFPAWTLVAFIYAFIGWFYESTIFSLCEQGKFMDRGVFIGPLCPIYCMVCTFSYDLFHPIQEWWLLIILAGTVTSIVELITSISMEALFHKRYWDYSYYPLNFDGRISVVAGLFFGIALMVMVKWVHPGLSAVAKSIPYNIRLIACIVLWCIFVIDMIWTTIGNMRLNKPIAAAYDKVIAWKQRRFDVLNVWKSKVEDTAPIRAFKWVLAKGKAINYKLVAAENTLKGKKNRSDNADVAADDNLKNQ